MEPTCGSAFDNPEIWSVATGQIQRTLGARHFPFDNIHFGKDFKSFRTSHNSVNRTNFVMTNDPEIGHTLFTLTSSQSADLENQSTAEFSHSVDEAGRIHIVEASHQTNSGETVDDLLKPIPGDVERFVLDAKTSPHDTYEILGTTLIASRGADNKVTVWDARTGRKKKTLMGTVDSSSKVFTDAKSGVLVAASDGLVRVWKIETGQMIASRQLSFTPAWIQFATDLPAIGIESELKRLESVVWDYERNKILFECDNAMRIGFETKDEPNFVTMAVDSPDTSPYLKSRDGKIIAASAEGTNDFCLWVKTGEAGNTRFFKLEDASEKVSNAQFSPGENYLITMSNAGIKAWDTKSGAIAATLGRGGNSVVNFNRDGSRLMIRTGHEIRFWNTVKWKIEPTVVSDVRDDLLSEDNRLVVFLTEKFEVQAWDFDSGRLIAKSHLPTVSSDSATIDTKMRHGRLDEIDLIQFTVGESIYLWNVLNDLPVKVYDSLDFRYGGYHGVWNSRMSFHSKGNLASIGDILIDLSTGKELASLHFLGEGDWLAVTPEGLFDGTEKGMQQVCYRIGDGLNVVPVEQFYQDFYRPGLLARIMNGERPLPDVEIGKSLPPKLRFIAPNDGTVTSDSEIMITVEAEDQGGGIQPLKLRRNGAPLRTAGQMVKEGNQLRQTFSVSLEPGDNILRLESASADGSWSSEPVVIRVKSVKDQVRPQLHVLTVGVSNYKADKLKLDFARRDAEAIGKLFFGRGKSLYEDVHLYPLYDGDATKPKLKSVCQQISKAAQPQDTLLIYLAGHGLTIGQRFFFIPADITLESRELEMDVKDQGIPTDTLLQSYLAGLTASKRMLVIDACNSGAAATLSKGKQRDAFAFQGAIERLARNEGLYVLAAASATEKAAEIKELQHGALTYSLLAAFGDVNDGPLTEKRAQPQSPDGVLSVFEWFSFASGEVPRLTEKYRGYAQEVRISGEGQSFPILPIEK